ncbi:MAG: metal-dependent transcriptional regulator [Blautia sp.]|nr:metal-dependent transcriptional regulator [Candidatus Blautia excrementigallinarum]
MQIRESAEDYLESILVLSQKGGGVRSVDIAARLGVSKPSVSHAMKLLREDGYIAMDRYGTVTLLEKGAEIANRIYERHTVLTKMLEGLGVPSDIARADACKMEHDISPESFERIKQHLKDKGEIR